MATSPRTHYADQFEKVWDSFFLHFPNPFTKYAWKKHQSDHTGTIEKVRSVYLDLMQKIFEGHITQGMGQRMMEVHTQKATSWLPWNKLYSLNPDLAGTIQFVFFALFPDYEFVRSRSCADLQKYLTGIVYNKERPRLAKLAKDPYAILLMAEKANLMKTKPDSPRIEEISKEFDELLIDEEMKKLFADDTYDTPDEIQKRFTIFFHELLKISFEERLSDQEQTLLELFASDPDFESLENLFKRSQKLKAHFDETSNILSCLDQIIREKSERHNLIRIRVRVQEDFPDDFIGATSDDWIQYLKDNPKEREKITYLTLSDLGLTYLPPSFTSLSFPNLKEIDLALNDLTFLPEPEQFFPQSPKIEEVYMSDNRIKDLDRSILQHCNLTIFRADHNLIRFLGNIGSNWTALQEFSCIGNRVDEISLFLGSSWRDCKMVELQHNPLSDHPVHIGQLKKNLPQSTVLKVGGNQQVLKAWEAFFIDFRAQFGCGFIIQEWENQKTAAKGPSEIVKSICGALLHKLPDQDVIDMWEFEELVERMEDEIFISYATPTLQLDQYFNQISALFHTLENAIESEQAVQNLSLIKEALEDVLPPFTGDVREWISYLENHPELLRNISKLQLSGLGLTYLPPQFTRLPFISLVDLDLSNNDLGFLPNDSDLFPASQMIESVNLDDNRLTYLSSKAFDQCKLMKRFQCNRNCLQKIGILGLNWRQLTHFSCRTNHLISLPPYFGGNWKASLVEVDFRENHFPREPKTQEMLDAFKNQFKASTVLI